MIKSNLEILIREYGSILILALQCLGTTTMCCAAATGTISTFAFVITTTYSTIKSRRIKIFAE